jgi:hypothetical protein
LLRAFFVPKASRTTMSASTGEKQPHPGQFKPGQSGNPKGRPRGARQRLGEQFLVDMMADWDEHGNAAIVSVREKNPSQYLRVVASILPKELNVRVNELDELTDEQLAAQLARVAEELARAGAAIGQGTGTPAAPEPARDVPTLQ